MNLEQLNCFIAVVEEGSISAGARRLNLTQPPVSLQLKNLEKRCGVRLLERSIGSLRIHLTEAGKSLYDTAKRMQDLAQSARQDMLNFRLGKKGSLHLGMISSGTGNTFFKGLAYFFQQNPGIPIQVLCRENFVAAGTPSWFPDPLPESLALDQLVEKPLLGYRRWEAILRQLCEKRSLPLFFRCTADDARSCLQWAQAGLDIALIPESVLSLSHDLVAIPLAEEALTSQVCLVRKKGRPLQEAARRFWDNAQ
ncbi:LysR family transcriptional regulator [Acidaminococcus timonensis]|uniref:LysR family transcriptional regulator n=1 Tax=Acidaminococcus timonensis TaxID=1871002 RepID=UPI00307B5393